MTRSRFSPRRIAGKFKKFESSQRVAEVYSEHGLWQASLYKWLQNYGVAVKKIKRMIELEEENARLKRMYTNASLEIVTASNSF